MLDHLRSEPRAPRRAVILGSRGFVGGAVAERLESASVNTLGLSSKALDLLAPDAAQKFAAQLRPGDAVVFVSALAPCKDVETLMKNLEMARAVCIAIADREIDQLIYISSDAVYADDANPVREDSATDPASLHGVMHRTREAMLRASTKAPVAVLRPSLLYGAADPHNGYGPNRFRRLARKGQEIQLFGEGEEQRDHVLIDDVAELVALCLEHRSQGTLNIATGKSVSFREVAETVARLSSGQAEVRGTPRQNPITHRHFDITATLKAFPSFRSTALEKGLERAEELDRG